MNRIAMPHILVRKKFTWLLLSLLFFIIIMPALDNIDLARSFVTIFFLILFMSGLNAISHHRRLLIFTSCIAISSFVAQCFALKFEDNVSIIIANSLSIIFCLLTAYFILIEILVRKKITVDEIRGCLSVYLLFGIAWTFAYTLIAYIEPTAFIYRTQMPADAQIMPRMMYYSFITLTTVGYGDITPNNTLTSELAYLEAIVGQIYLVVLVARLVGFHVAQQTAKLSSEADD